MGEFRIGRKFAQHSYPDAPKGLSVQGASAWGDNAALVQTAGAATPIVVCSATITPQITGKIRVSVSGEVFNSNNSSQTVQLYLSRSGASDPFPGDYSVLQMILEATGEGLNDAESFSTVVRYDIAAPGGFSTLPITFPIGAPVTFSLVMQATAAGVEFAGHGGQIDLQEVR